MNKYITIIIILISLSGCSSLNTRDTKISKYFSSKEATYSDTGKKYKISNEVPRKLEDNIYYSAKRLDKFRAFLGKPINVTGWYRNKKINKKVNGSKTSAHVLGLAIDFRVAGNSKTTYKKIINSNLKFDQLFYYPRSNRFHISFKRDQKLERREYRIIY
ncbi:MAG: D-Ala-D-Ala carboxypeptidase family metallohydrolase [Cetobacterium sp.]|uniref:D-Ala-D-Ala carboxypeptidase family metallohydrolase n=1 Tax=Cetobacterium sp. TaxID=2071632 RepID=UPI002FC620FC